MNPVVVVHENKIIKTQPHLDLSKLGYYIGIFVIKSLANNVCLNY